MEFLMKKYEAIGTVQKKTAVTVHCNVFLGKYCLLFLYKNRHKDINNYTY